MVDKLLAKNHYDLMWEVSRSVNPHDYPEKRISYFLLNPESDTQYAVKNMPCYDCQETFSTTVAWKIGRNKLYAVISKIEEETLLCFGGLDFYAEFRLDKNNQWELIDVDCFDLNAPDRTPAQMRLDIFMNGVWFKKMPC